MRIFRRKKNAEQTQSTTPPKNSTENLNSFLHSNAVSEAAMEPPKTAPVPYHYEESFSTSVQYYLPEPLLEFIGSLDREVNEYISKNNLDEFNVNFWENRISNIIELSMAKLQMQKARHENVIEDLRIYNSAELERLEGELEILKKELADKEAYLELLMERKPNRSALEVS